MQTEAKQRGLVRRMLKARSGPVAWMFYLCVRTLFAFMNLFPIEWNLRTARVLARAWPKLAPRHRDRAIEHLTTSLGKEYSRVEIERMADRCLESVAMFAVEAICLPRLINAYNWNRYIDMEDFAEGFEAILSGKGVILVTGHYGSFEVLAHLLAGLGLDIVAVMRPLDNVHLNRLIVESRGSTGLTLLDKKGAASQAQSILEDGKLLAFVGDQDAGRKGMFVDFFGQPASTYKSIGLLAMSTQSPIVVGYARRQGKVAKYSVGIERVIHPHEWENQEDPLRWITQAYTSAIEASVRKEPEQYLWIHRRWKSKPRVRAR